MMRQDYPDCIGIMRYSEERGGQARVPWPETTSITEKSILIIAMSCT
jgi:hypothetical protein